MLRGRQERLWRRRLGEVEGGRVIGDHVCSSCSPERNVFIDFCSVEILRKGLDESFSDYYRVDRNSNAFPKAM